MLDFFKKTGILSVMLLFFLLLTGCSLPQIDVPGKDGTYNVKVYSYIQDPESGEYTETLKETKAVQKGEDYSVSPETVQYHVLNTEKCILSVTSIQKNTTLKLYYDCETCVVTFLGGGGSLVSGVETQTLRKGQTPQMPTYTRSGYVFVGFNAPISSVFENAQYTAIWQVQTFTLTLQLPQGALIADTAYTKVPTTGSTVYCREITAESEFTLPTPYCDLGSFRGWKYVLSDTETVSGVSRGTTSSITLYADFGQDLCSMTFVGVGIPNIAAYYLPAGTAVWAPVIPPEQQRVGYGLNWYADSACTTLYQFTTMPNGGATVYGKWEVDTGASFVGWDVDSEEIDNFAELKTFIEYVVFHNITTPLTVPCNFATYSTIEKYITDAYEQLDFRASGSITYGVTGNAAKYSVRVASAETTRSTDASKTTQKNDMEVYSYVGYTTQGRDAAFDNFYIDLIPVAVPVETSNQLAYVVERGAKPLCKAGSAAETVYAAARAVLRKIIIDSYTDAEKAEAIFNYLVLNVQYDYAQVESQLPYDWTYYDAYYLEGVFLRNKAVCDGISKAFALLCGIEGIPCVQVTGAQYSGKYQIAGTGHAWCKVKINNNWYLADPTFANLRISGTKTSVLDHGMFLTDETKKSADGYVADNYHNIVCNKDYGYFDKKDVRVAGVDIDFVIDSVQEFSYMLEYCMLQEENLVGFSVDFVYNISSLQYKNNIGAAYNAAVTALRGRGKVYQYTVSRLDNGFGSVVKLIFK